MKDDETFDATRFLDNAMVAAALDMIENSIFDAIKHIEHANREGDFKYYNCILACRRAAREIRSVKEFERLRDY